MYEQLRDVWQELTAPGAPFEVHQVEAHGVPVRAYASAPSSLRDVWLSSAGHGEKEHLVYEDERWTFDDAHRDVISIASWLLERGVGPRRSRRDRNAQLPRVDARLLGDDLDRGDLRGHERVVDRTRTRIRTHRRRPEGPDL